MPLFSFEARTESGEFQSGMISADSLAEAGRKLSEQGHYVVKLGVTEASDSQPGGSREGASRLKAKRQSVMWFMNQMAVMVETGINIGDALEILARQPTDPVMQEILQDVSTAVQEGRPLSDALEEYPRSFPPVAVAMVRASEASGTLSTILNRIAAYSVKDHEAMSRLRGALMYPAFMFVMCISVTVFLLTVILPRFTVIYAAKGATLPAPTRILLSLSRNFPTYGLAVIAGLVAAGVGFHFYARTPKGREFRDRMQLRIPLLGTLLSTLFQGRTFRALGTLLDAGVPVDKALRLAQEMSSNTLYRKLWVRVETGVTNGERIPVSLAQEKLLSESVVQMIDCGDRSGKLGYVFNRLADFLEQEYDRALKVVSQFVEPLMIIVMGGIIGFVAIAMLLPMFKVASVVAR
jgi:type II secretory pathway component PulF